MKNKNSMEMFRSVEDQVIKNTEPLLRQKVLEQVCRSDVRFCVLACCLLGPRRAREAISQASHAAATQVGPILRPGLPPNSELAEGLSAVPRNVVNEELIRRVIDSIITKMEGIAETTIRQELFRLIYWGSTVLFIVTHVIHWIAF